jgi:hypothetical protein
LYNSIPHFSSGSFSAFNGYRAKLLMERKRSEKDDCSASITTTHFDFLLQEAGNARSGNWNLGGKWMLIVRLIYEERSFDLVANNVLYNFFRLFNSSMVNFFVFSNFQLLN